MLLQALKNEKLTENGAITYESTLNPLLDFFAQAGSMRNRSEQDILVLFNKALLQDEVKAIQLLFYFRDVRGGQGERRLFKICFKSLTRVMEISKLIPLVVEYGRYDDLYCLVGTTKEREMFEFLYKQFKEDLESEYPSLLAKWLKSENASSKETKELAKLTRKYFRMNSKEYRKALSKLRNKLNIIERKMSNNEWSDIEYDKIPSKAGIQYRYAFMRHDHERYADFMKPKDDQPVKLNARTLYPYEITNKVMYGMNETERNVLNNYWANIPDYLNGDNSNALAVIDVSGSMTGTPMEVAISLGLYMAERNQGPFHNHFITFSSRPQLIELDEDDDFVDKVNSIRDADWGFNTDIKKVFKLILRKAVKYNMKQSDIPEIIYVISDMEFDCAVEYNNKDSLFENIRREYAQYGYKLPHIVFWNVDSRQNNIPMVGVGNYSLVSGFSPVIFEMVMSQKSAEEVMEDVLNKDRYKKIRDILEE